MTAYSTNDKVRAGQSDVGTKSNVQLHGHVEYTDNH